MNEFEKIIKIKIIKPNILSGEKMFCHSCGKDHEYNIYPYYIHFNGKSLCPECFF